MSHISAAYVVFDSLSFCYPCKHLDFPPFLEKSILCLRDIPLVILFYLYIDNDFKGNIQRQKFVDKSHIKYMKLHFTLELFQVYFTFMFTLFSKYWVHTVSSKFIITTLSCFYSGVYKQVLQKGM